MGLKYADVCKECGMRKTRHPSGLCCRCRLTGPKSTCKFCGARTRNGHDCCYRCRQFQKVSLDYDAALAAQQKRLLILKLRKDGMSYGEIASAVALAKSEVFDAVKEMMRLPADITPEILEKYNINFLAKNHVFYKNKDMKFSFVCGVLTVDFY